MINILIVSPTGGYAGIDVCIESLVYKMNRNIFNPIVVFPEGAKLKKDFEDKGIKCYSLPLNWWFPISYTGNDIIHSLNGMSPKVDALSQIIKDNNVELVISNTSINFDAAIASNICGVKHVFFMHAGYVDNIYVDMLQSTKEQLYTLMGQLSNKVICCSKMLDDMMKHYVNNSICIYTGVDTDKFIYKERSLSEQDILNMVCIGHYNSNKQQDFVIKALNEVQKQRPELLENIHYTMIGPGEPAYIKKLKHMTKEFKLGKYVTFKGFTDCVHKTLNEYNLYINSSITESLPLSVMEAMSNGMPVLGSKNDGTRQLIENGKTGFICETPEEMAEKIIYLVENKDEIRKMSFLARKRVEEYFCVEKYVKHFEEVFLKIVQEEELNVNHHMIETMYSLLIKDQIKRVQDTKYKVLVIYPEQASATYYITAKNPLDYLSKKGILEYKSVTTATLKEDDIDEADIVYCIRYFDEYTHSKLEYAKSRNKPFIWYIDDNYFALKVEDGEVKHTEIENKLYKDMFMDSDAVIVNNGELYHIGNKLGAKVYRLPTYQIIEDSILKKCSPTIKIGFMGTLKRDDDFKEVEVALRRIKEEYKDKVAIEFIGYAPEALEDISSRFDFMPDYNEFRAFFASRAWDIALAPLRDTLFNRSKTNNKYREYSSFKIPGIYSNITTYNTCIKDGVNGLLVENSSEAWYEAIKRLIIDEELREHISNAAYLDIKKNYNIDQFAYGLSNILVDHIITSKSLISRQVVVPSTPFNDGSMMRQANIVMPPMIPIDFLNYSRRIYKKKVYRVTRLPYCVNRIGILFATEGDKPKGQVTMNLYYRGNLLRTATINMKTINYNAWNYFDIQTLVGANDRKLDIELVFSYAKGSCAIGVYEDCEHRNYIYKLLNRMHLTYKVENVLCIDYR